MSLSRSLQYLFLAIIVTTVGFSLYQWNASRASTQKTAPRSGLVGYWSFDENTGTLAGDASGNGNAGTLTNGPTWVAGKLGKAVSFDGVNDFVDAGNSANLMPAFPFTVSTWVKDGGVITTADPANNGEYSGYTIMMTSGGGITARIGSNGGNCSGTYRNDYATTATTMTAGQWYHVTVVFTNASSFSIFVNGASASVSQSGTNGLAIGYAAGARFRIGKYFAACGGTTVFYGGSVDETRVYNRALSGTEVTNLYNLGAEKLNAVDLKSAPLNGLAGVWSFNSADISGTTAYDRSGNGNNGTLTNGPIAVPGRLAQGVFFDGVDDYMDAGTAASLKPTFPFSIALWVKRATAGESVVVTTGAPGTSGTYSAYTLTVGADLSAQIGSGAGCDCVPGCRYTMVTSSAPVTVGTWHHVVVIFTAIGNFRAIVDGVNASMTYSGGGAASMVYDAGSRFRINSSYGCSTTFYQTGSVDDVRVYNRELSFAEAQSLYAFGAAKMNIATPPRADSSAGLTGYWNLDDNTGTTATDSSVNAKNGTLTNGPTWGTGKSGSDVVFDGTDDYIDLGATSTAAFNYSGDVSGAAWVKTSTNGRMILQYQNGNPLIYVSVGPTSNGGTANKLVVYLRTNFGSFYLFSGEKTLTDGAWHHVAFSRDTVAKKVLLYVDGAMDGVYPYTDTAAINTSGGTHIISNSSTYAFNGEIDDVRMYNRVLSPSEVKELSLLMPADTSLKGYWSFNGPDLSGTTAYDRSGNGNNGTLTNGPTAAIGKSGQALNFDGTDDYVDIGSTPLLTAGSPFSLSWWEKITTDNGTYPSRFLFKLNGSSNYFVVIRTHNDASYGPLDFGRSPNVGLSIRASGQPTTASGIGIWRHYVITGSDPNSTTPANYNLYVNAVSYSLDNGNNFSALSGNSRIGYIGSNDGADTRIDEVRIYNRALTATEVAALYNSGR